MEVMALSVKLKEEGAATVESALKKLRLSTLLTSVSIGTTLTLALRKLVDATSEAQAVQAQLGNALRATDSAAGQTLDSLNAHAASLQAITTFGDEAINKAQARLLSYTSIVGENFTRATEVVLDYAAAFNTDLVQASEAVGKALNYPTQGLGLLSKQGFIFTESQKEQIKFFEETNQLAKAQAIIFEELESVTKGAAAAQRNTLGGALKALQNAWGDLFEISRESSQGIIDAIEGITATLPKLRAALNDTFLAWGVLLVDIELGIARLSKSLAESNLRWAEFFSNVTFGLAADGLRAQETKRLQQAEMDLAALETLKLERQQKIAAAVNGVTTATQAHTRAVREQIPATIAVTDADRLRETGLRQMAATYPLLLERLRAYRRELALEREQTTREQREQGERRQAQFGISALIPAPADLSKAFKPLTEETRRAVERAQFGEVVRKTLADSVTSGVEDGFASGIAAAIASGRISDAWRAMGQAIIQNIASAMAQVALKAIQFGTLLEKVRAFMVANPAAAVATAAALLAFAYANGGKAESAGMAVGGGRGGAMFAPTMSPMTSQPTQIIFGQTSATTAAGMTPRSATNVTIIGPDDPKAQRAIEELITKGNRRGTLG
jgi:hypothetical protein